MMAHCDSSKGARAAINFGFPIDFFIQNVDLDQAGKARNLLVFY